MMNTKTMDPTTADAIQHFLQTMELPEDSISAVLSHLFEIGVKNNSDLMFVTEADLTTLLKPIHARRFLHQLKTGKFLICIIHAVKTFLLFIFKFEQILYFIHRYFTLTSFQTPLTP